MRRNWLTLFAFVICVLALVGMHRRREKHPGPEFNLADSLEQSAITNLTHERVVLKAAPEEKPHFFGMRNQLSEELRSLAGQNPKAALSLLNELPESILPEFASAIASSWAKTQPGLAAVWARDQLEGETREKALLSLSADWAAAEPLSAVQCALDFFSGPRQLEFLQNVARQWGKQDSITATAWADNLPNGVARDAFLAGVCSDLADSDPIQAATLAASLRDPQLQNETALTIVLAWGRTQPEQAANWVKRFPEGPLRQQALNSLASLCAEQSATPSILLGWPQGPELDQAIRHYLDTVLESEPARGAEVLASISQEVLRQEEAQRVAQYWLMKDPSAASQWLRTDGFQQIQTP